MDSKTSIKKTLESKYDIKVTAGWDEDELLQLQTSLSKTSSYLGGADNLNASIQASLSSCTKCGGRDYLTIYNLTGSGYCSGASYNCYDKDTGTITISDGAFSPSYQAGKNRPKELGLNTTNMGVQVSIVHEISHMLGVARPVALSVYNGYVSNPTALSPNNGAEENRANALAYYIVSGGKTLSRYKYQDQLDYARDVAFLWHYSH